MALFVSRTLSLARPGATRNDQIPFAVMLVLLAVIFLLLPMYGLVLTNAESR